MLAKRLVSVLLAVAQVAFYFQKQAEVKMATVLFCQQFCLSNLLEHRTNHLSKDYANFPPITFACLRIKKRLLLIYIVPDFSANIPSLNSDILHINLIVCVCFWIC